MSEKGKDVLNWGVMKKKIDETPRLLKAGETITVLYEAVEEVPQMIKWTDPMSGKVSEFPVVNIKLPVKLPSGARGFVWVRMEEFSEIAQRFHDAGFPKELPYSRPANTGRRR
jgi:hypothetical protein